MTFKKNRITDLIWAVTAAIIGLNIVGYVKLFLSGIQKIESFKSNGSILYDVLLLGGSAAVMGVLVLLFLLVRLLVKRFGPGEEKAGLRRKKFFCGLAEAMVFLGILGGGFFLRYEQLFRTLEWKLADDFYYQLATIKIDESLPSLSHMASYFYISVLSLVMSVLGNRIFSAVVLQFILELLTIVFLYLGIRRLTGVIPAVVSSCVFAVSYSNCALLMEADAQCLVFFLFSVAVYFTAGLFEVYRKDVKSCSLVFRIIFAGLFSGLCCFLEPYCMMVLLLGLALCFQNSDWYSGKTKVSLFCAYLLVTVASCLIGFTVTAVCNDIDLSFVISDWIISLVQAKPIGYAFYFEQAALRSFIEGMVLVCLAFFTLPGYHVWEQTKQMPFLLLLFLAPVPFCTMGFLEYDLFSLWIWAVLAGIGLQLMILPKKKAAVVTETEVLSEEAPAEETNEEDTEIEEAITEQEEEIDFEELTPPEIVSAEKNVTTEELAEEATKEPVAETMEINTNFIPNPLPVPKKHVKRVADYEISVSEDDDFDLAVDENDDFDFT